MINVYAAVSDMSDYFRRKKSPLPRNKLKKLKSEFSALSRNRMKARKSPDELTQTSSSLKSDLLRCAHVVQGQSLS